MLSLLLLCGLYYFKTPTIAYDFVGIYVVLLVAALPAVALSGRIGVMAAYAALALILGAVVFLTSAPILHAGAYYKMLGQETQANFHDALPPIDIDQAPLVSQDMALQAMQKRLSEIASLGSQVRVGTPVKQLVKDKLVWVAFLEHSGFFKWFSDGATPGYLIVSAHDPADVHLIMTLNGKPLKLRYLQSAYFNDDVERHAYLSGQSTVGLTDFEPEIDDNGVPYYVGTVYEHRVGFSGSESTGIVTVNAVSGEVVRYKLGDEPKWVDRIQAEEFILEQMQDRGEYIHGYINLNNDGRLRVEGELDLVYGSDQRPYWVGGMTSKGKNNGLSGFYFVDSRTKAVRWFKVPSVSQDTAAHAVENVNPEKHYKATNPLPFLVGGAPTYVMALRDSQGVSRAFGMVDMRNNQIIGVADTLSATLRSYQSRRSTNRVAADVGTEAREVALKGTVMRIASEFRNNQTMYYITLATGEKTLGIIFTGSSDLSEELVLTKAGDKVELSYSDSNTRVVGMSKFHNTDIPGL
ncbi:hypothetical protein KW842_18060 [Duganella sp. sic0402]|uniref:hypothetical protein n=1 Tax=Duganella sp. sic0402 TaxID=2854786 RepID=UPI001C466DD8|nr:hypothetical protein [Duganella sp. sic0402]MBV7537676.1 hypothetical protein [Duganella sp. sic0402]